jgi:hypothetical protein
MKRGRPRLHQTDAARRTARLVSKAKTKNVTVDADLVELLNVAADRLEEKLGFRPSLSQTLRHLIKQGID